MNETVLHDRHVALGANMVDFAGWHMPLHYPAGIIREHLAVRGQAGLFDVSHMGRYAFRGKGALAFLQHLLTNNAAGLEPGHAQYTLIANETGGALDDAYLYRFVEEEYLLVVNAGNRPKDWDYFQAARAGFPDVEMTDRSGELAMISLQGPASRAVMERCLTSGSLPEPARNRLSVAGILKRPVLVGRTGYTGEALAFELFVKSDDAAALWNGLLEQPGVTPVGLGARDTLRLEAGLPLYGHELGLDPEGKEIPVFASPLSRFAVSFSPLKGDFVGRTALHAQYEALQRITRRDYSSTDVLPRLIKPVALLDRGVARAGFKIFAGEKHAGYVTSGTTVPYLKFAGRGLLSRVTEEKGMRSIGLALLDNCIRSNDGIEIEIRGERKKALVAACHLRSETPPFTRPVIAEAGGTRTVPRETDSGAAGYAGKVRDLLSRTVENTAWRQQSCLNLIPSEQTPSPMTRLLSVMDPAFRYAEHKSVKAYHGLDVFYYQGVEFIREVERSLVRELCAFLGCRHVETRLISGQMANMAAFSAVMDYLNRTNRKGEPARIRCAVNNHIIRGGHLSSQPMGGLKDFVARDPVTESPYVANFPVRTDNPYRIDVAAAKTLIADHKPELIVFGKSLVLHPEPVREIKAFVDELGLPCVVMYDMAHVLGLVGPFFQEPFREGADIVTGSTHKTFFGTQRGVAAMDCPAGDIKYPLWTAVKNRTFPGSLSNHHLGTLLGLLMSAYEMNCFKHQYQPKVLANAKAFARALKDAGLDVSGDPAVSYTETHQVLLRVGHAKGPAAAAQLEANNIIVNYQATAEDEGFSAAGSLRMGVQEMTRFGMEAEDFRTVAQFIRDVVTDGKSVKDEVAAFRRKFLDLKFCFPEKEFEPALQKLHALI